MTAPAPTSGIWVLGPTHRKASETARPPWSRQLLTAVQAQNACPGSKTNAPLTPQLNLSGPIPTVRALRSQMAPTKSWATLEWHRRSRSRSPVECCSHRGCRSRSGRRICTGVYVADMVSTCLQR